MKLLKIFVILKSDEIENHLKLKQSKDTIILRVFEAKKFNIFIKYSTHASVFQKRIFHFRSNETENYFSELWDSKFIFGVMRRKIYFWSNDTEFLNLDKWSATNSCD